MTLEQVIQEREITEHVRAAVLSLEECYRCRRITECTQGTVADGCAWLCLDCYLSQLPGEAATYDHGAEQAADFRS